MKKTTFVDHVDRYHLGGLNDSVIWEVKSGKVKIDFVFEDKTLIGSLGFDGVDIEDSKFGIFTTSELLKLLGAMEGDMKIALNVVEDKTGKKPANIVFSDSKLQSKYILADPAIFAPPAKIKNTPEWDFSAEITHEFISNFIKAKNALDSAKNVALLANSDEGSVTFIMGHSETNTNTIKFSLECPVKNDIKTHVNFNAAHIKAIFTANKDAENGYMNVSEQGLMEIGFKNSDFTSRYFLVMMQA